MTQEIKMPVRWQEEDNTITFTLTSDGRTGDAWIEDFSMKDVELSVCTKTILQSPKFKYSNFRTYSVVIIKRSILSFKHCFNSRVLREAKQMGCERPPIELACLIRDSFSDEKIKSIGLSSIAVMHKPVIVDGHPYVLCSTTYDKKTCLKSYHAATNRYWGEGTGFAFLAPNID